MVLNKEYILYRVFNKIIIIELDSKQYTIKAPTALLRYQAEIYKQKIINEYKYELPHLDTYELFLISKQFIDNDYESKIDNMSKSIKRLKVDLYKCGPLIEREKQVRQSLIGMKNKLNTYISNLETMRRPTLEYFSESLKNKFILIKTIFYNDRLLFNSDDLNLNLLNRVIDHLNEQDVGGAEFREIARTTPWQDYWRCNKGDLFGTPSIEYSEDQKILCSLSRMYDSVWEHPESPPENIIEDDDKLDGFLIYHSEKNQQDKKKEISNLDDKYTEVYLPAKNMDEAASIYAANSEYGKRVLRDRAKVLKQNSEVSDIMYKDVQLDVLEKTSAQESQLMRRK